jgi:methyl-accepting chemotaxis protein
MKIRSKLMLSSSIILVLMAVIGASAIVGIKFIQKNIFLLTQKSTPYQIKTLNHQRALQAHASNLLKLAGSESVEEYGRNSTQSNESLSEEIKSAEELVKLGSTSDYEADAISENTRSIRDMTQKRLQLQHETQTVVQGMRGNLSDAAKRLQGLDTSIRRLQQGAAGKMVSNIDLTSSENKQATTLAALRDGLKDVNLYVSRVMTTADKDAVEDMYDNLAGTLNNMQVYVRTIKWSDRPTGEDFAKKLDEMSAKLSESKDEYVKFLALRDASARAKAVQATRDAETVIAAMQTTARMETSKSKTGLDASSQEMSTSINAFSETNTVLILSSEILFSSAVIDSQVNYSLAVKGVGDFDKTVAAVQGEFGRIDATANKLKALFAKGKFKHESKLLADSLGALATVRQGFLGKEGAAEKIKASLKNIEDVAKLNQKMKEMVAKQIEQSGKDVVIAQKSQESAVASVRSAVSTTVMLIIVISAIAVLASIGLSRWIGVSITSPVRELMVVAESFGNGDFGKRMDESRKDEFGDLAVHLNHATSKLGEITSHLKQVITRLSESSKDLRATAEDLYNGAQEQASQTEQSVTAMTEISCTINDMAKNARDAAGASKDALDTATVGKDVVTKTVKGMNEIADFVMGASGTIGKLSQSSEKIGEILNTINDIADQTNLLALNAAIEAARAGDQGRGFAVVADEVRKLAQSTGEATHEIAAIVHEIQTDTARSVSAMNSGKVRVEEGVKLSGEASTSLEAILGASERGVHMARMIATATDDQSSASEGVSQGMEKVATITNRLKKSTEGIKRSSEELSGLAHELHTMASWFKVTA